MTTKVELMPTDFEPRMRKPRRGRNSDKYGVSEAARIAKEHPGAWVRLAGPIKDAALRHTLASSIRNGKRRQTTPAGKFEAVANKDIDHVFIRYSGDS